MKVASVPVMMAVLLISAVAAGPLTTEAARRIWTPWWLEALWDLTSDVRYAVRALAKTGVFSLTVIPEPGMALLLGLGLVALAARGRCETHSQR